MGTQNKRYESLQHLSELEANRINLQNKLDSENTSLHKRALGQFATPFSLANEIVEFALSHFVTDPISYLEPALGTGAFFSALLSRINSDQLKFAIGFEIDPPVADIAQNIWGQYLDVKNLDFTQVTCSQPNINLLLTNPPYVRHQLLTKETKEFLFDRAKAVTGIQLSKLSGLYCYFMLIAHQWLCPDAISAWLIPSEFMDVNYGTGIKEYLLNNVELLRIHRYDPHEAQFDDATVSSCVVWFRNRQNPDDYCIEFSYGGTHSNPHLKKTLLKSTLQKERKWTRFPEKKIRNYDHSISRFQDFFTIKRGIATGDNSFFIVNESTIYKHNLRSDYLQPILPSPRKLSSDLIEADELGSPKLDERLFLINCSLSEVDIQNQHPELWDYLKSGIGTTSEKYLCKSRKKWYFQETRNASPLLCTYMGRNVMKSERPFHFLLNQSNAIATNSYLMIYPRHEVQKQIERNPEIINRIWAYLNSLTTDDLENESRVYGGGLRKIEPKELGQILCPNLNVIIYGTNHPHRVNKQLMMPFLLN